MGDCPPGGIPRPTRCRADFPGGAPAVEGCSTRRETGVEPEEIVYDLDLQMAALHQVEITRHATGVDVGREPVSIWRRGGCCYEPQPRDQHQSPSSHREASHRQVRYQLIDTTLRRYKFRLAGMSDASGTHERSH